MQFEQDKISSYYHSSTKPVLFFYRTSIIVSMVLLLGVLGVNLYANLDNSRLQTQSKAANPSSEQVALPTLPQGCFYKQIPGGKVVVCNTPTPAHITPTIAPSLPPQCHYVTTANGTTISCTAANGQTFTIPLPQK